MEEEGREKEPYPVSLLVPLWKLLWEIHANSRLLSPLNQTIILVPNMSVEHITGRSLSVPLFFLYLSVDFVQPGGTRETKAVCL